MAEKETLILSDKKIVPDDEYIFTLLGGNKIFWQQIINYAKDNYKDISGVWNYYNDGKQWLFKLTQKKKTILWSGILKDTFRITFWFPDRAETIIDSSELPQRIKDEFKTSKKYGATRGVSIKVFEQSDVENIKVLIGIKTKIK